MNVIFVTDSYYPNPSPNAICVEKLRDVFNNRNIKTDIIALRTFPKLMNNSTDEHVHFVSPDLLYELLYKYNKSDRKYLMKCVFFLFKIRSLFNGMFWPLMSIPHLFRYTIKIGKLLKQNDGDTIVVGVYKSLEAALAGAIAKKIWGRGVYFLYTLDAVSGSIIPKIYGSARISHNSIKRWERFLFKNYDFLFLMSSHESYYSQKEYDLCRHNFRYVDIPLFAARKLSINIREDKIHLVFTGSLSTTTAYPVYLLKILDFLQDDSLTVDFYGNIADASILDLIEHSKYANYFGQLTHDEVVTKQNNADFLLNFGNDTPCAIPCKIFEYFSTGKPVVSFLKIDEDASKLYVEKYPNSLIIDERDSVEMSAQLFHNFIHTNHEIDIKKVELAFTDNAPESTVNKMINDFLSCRIV